MILQGDKAKDSLGPRTMSRRLARAMLSESMYSQEHCEALWVKSAFPDKPARASLVGVESGDLEMVGPTRETPWTIVNVCLMHFGFTSKLLVTS